MFCNGNALPTLMSTSAPLSTTWPTCNPFGAIIYRFSPSAYTNKAMLVNGLDHIGLNQLLQ